MNKKIIIFNQIRGIKNAISLQYRTTPNLQPHGPLRPYSRFRIQSITRKAICMGTQSDSSAKGRKQ